MDGEALDTVAACPPLTIVETAKLRAAQGQGGASPRTTNPPRRVRRSSTAQAKRLAERTGMSEQAAREEIARQCEGVLLPDVELPFDDDDLAGCTVADVLADPERFEGATLADPLEGVDYGTCKARIMRRADGTPWINSFAHGRTTYQLKHNASTVRAAMDQAADDAVVKTFVKLALVADLSAAGNRGVTQRGGRSARARQADHFNHAQDRAAGARRGARATGMRTPAC